MEKKVKLTICNNEYSFTTDDSVEYMQEIGKEVDEKINEILNANQSVSQINAAVFVALDYCDKAKRFSKDADGLRAQISTYLDDANKTRMQLDNSRKEIEKLTNQVKQLQARLVARDAVK